MPATVALEDRFLAERFANVRRAHDWVGGQQPRRPSETSILATSTIGHVEALHHPTDGRAAAAPPLRVPPFHVGEDLCSLAVRLNIVRDILGFVLDFLDAIDVVGGAGDGGGAGSGAQ